MFSIFFLVKKLLRSSGIFTNDERKALTMHRRKFLWICLVFTIWYGIVNINHILTAASSFHASVDPMVISF